MTGNGGNDALDGGQGNDTYFFSGSAWGNDTLTDAGGTDTLDFSAATDNLTFSINSGSLSVTSLDGNSLSAAGNSIERLLGGSGNDSFVFANGVSLADGGTSTFIDGGLGTNTLDYSAYTSPVYVNLSTGEATGVNQLAGLAQPGGIARIQNVVGGLVATEIWGDNNDNTLISPKGSLHTNLHGLGGNDTYIFYDNWGDDHVFDTAGNDTLDFINITSDQNLTFSFASGSATVSDGHGDTVVTDGNIENFIGGAGNDRFVFQTGGSIHGNLDGAGGYNTLDDSACTSTCDVTLTAGHAERLPGHTGQPERFLR